DVCSSDLVLLDFTEHDVGGGLAALTAVRGIPVNRIALPNELHRIDLLATASTDECAELLAEAVHGLRQSTNHADARALHADLLNAVRSEERRVGKECRCGWGAAAAKESKWR